VRETVGDVPGGIPVVPDMRLKLLLALAAVARSRCGRHAQSIRLTIA